MSHNNLKLSLRRQPNGAYSASLHASMPNHDALLVADVSIDLDPTTLLALLLARERRWREAQRIAYAIQDQQLRVRALRDLAQALIATGVQRENATRLLTDVLRLPKTLIYRTLVLSTSSPPLENGAPRWGCL